MAYLIFDMTEIPEIGLLVVGDHGNYNLIFLHGAFHLGYCLDSFVGKIL